MAFKNFKVETDSDGIVLVTWDTPGRSMNVLDETSVTELEEIVKQTSADAAVKGVVITSGKEALCAGADLSMLEGMSRQYAELLKTKGEVAANQMLFDQSRRFSQVFRKIETSGKPWVAAINGLALGGGFELTLSCHYRVAAENPKTRLGLPEIKVGLFPGAGGTQRVPRIVQPQDAMQLLLKGEAINLDRAKALKLIHAIVPAADLIKAAKDWIKGGGKAVAPWDEKGFKLPGGQVFSKAGMMMFPAGNAIYRRETYDNYPAARAIMSCVYEGLQLPIDAGAAGRIALLHQDPALQGSRGDDPQPVPVDAGIEQGRAASAERAADQSEKTRRDRRRLHGRQRRLRLGARRHRRGADRPRPGKRRQGQGPRQGRDRRSDQEGPRQGKRSRRHPRPHQRDRRLQRPEGLRSHHRGGVRGSQGKAETYAKAQPLLEGRRDLCLQHLDAADQFAGGGVQGPGQVHRHPFLLAGREDDAGRDHRRQEHRRHLRSPPRSITSA